MKKALLDLEPLPPFHNIVVRLTIIDETHIAPVLDDIAEAAGVDVEIGSYPVCFSAKSNNSLIAFAPVSMDYF